MLLDISVIFPYYNEQKTIEESLYLISNQTIMPNEVIFVEDVVDLYLLISEELSKNPEFYRGEIYNAGTNNPISVRKIIETIYGNIGNHKELEKIIKLMSEKKTIGEINCQFMDFEKVNKSFGWIPIHNFNDGLTKTINWYRKFFKEIY